MRTLAIAALCIAFVPSAHAAEEAGIASSAKSIRVNPPREAVVISSREAPFVAALPVSHDADLAFLQMPEKQPPRSASPSSCDSARTLCYDPAGGHIIYKPARAWMPDLPGLQRENISFRRDRVVLRYSFK